eukprot:Skav226177  [mRNA]  locus=scaffold2212:43329:44076:- [translate_table: standard]
MPHVSCTSPTPLDTEEETSQNDEDFPSTLGRSSLGPCICPKWGSSLAQVPTSGWKPPLQELPPSHLAGQSGSSERSVHLAQPESDEEARKLNSWLVRCHQPQL